MELAVDGLPLGWRGLTARRRPVFRGISWREIGDQDEPAEPRYLTDPGPIAQSVRAPGS
jgi:hypothetical protein